MGFIDCATPAERLLIGHLEYMKNRVEWPKHGHLDFQATFVSGGCVFSAYTEDGDPVLSARGYFSCVKVPNLNEDVPMDAMGDEEWREFLLQVLQALRKEMRRYESLLTRTQTVELILKLPFQEQGMKP